jgi:hypothetical protein
MVQMVSQDLKENQDHRVNQVLMELTELMELQVLLDQVLQLEEQKTRY